MTNWLRFWLVVWLAGPVAAFLFGAVISRLIRSDQFSERQGNDFNSNFGAFDLVLHENHREMLFSASLGILTGIAGCVGLAAFGLLWLRAGSARAVRVREWRVLRLLPVSIGFSVVSIALAFLILLSWAAVRSAYGDGSGGSVLPEFRLYRWMLMPSVSVGLALLAVAVPVLAILKK